MKKSPSFSENTMTLEWKDSYRLGDARIDEQHQHLFTLANAMLSVQEQDALRLCAMQLYQHVRTHFANEESAMKRMGFPHYKAHVKSHNAILERLSVISQDIGKNQVDPAVVRDFLNHWGLHHIPKEDAELATFLKTHQLPSFVRE
jgi:hemerythrin-like metal-binding protein